jgi:hypothetical protein
LQAIAVEELIRQEKFEEVVQFFADHLIVGEDRDKVLMLSADHDVIREAAYYYAAWLQVAEGRQGLAVEYVSRIPAAIMRDVGLCSYTNFREDSFMLYGQIKAQSGKPVVLIAAMPKSASSYVSSITSALAGMPIVRTTFGQFPKLVAIPRWLQTLRQFGGVTHEHLMPTTWTLECIVSAGITDIFVQHRDPRAAAWSAYMQHPEHPEIERFIRSLKHFNEWLDGWLGIRDAKPPFRLHFISYDDVRNKPEQVFNLIFEVSGHKVNQEALRASLVKASNEKHNYNFRSGNPKEWREMLPPDHVAMSNTLLTPRVEIFIGENYAA